MYLNFYQLHKKPFSLAPDPDFLYLSQQHKDALGAIIYGIREREGFVSVVGEVGTGKTTIIRSYLQKTDRNKVLPIFIFNSKISFSELLQTFLREIGVAAELIKKYHQMNDMVRLAYQVMLSVTGKGKNIVLIIDEAQNMPVETLGNLCILSNFETSKDKLIQIILVGQPELQEKLDLHELRQLRQRIAYRAQITPLSTQESIKYLQHRLLLAAEKPSKVFTAGAIRRIVKQANGVPRVINIICENALVAGYGIQKKPVSAKLVKQVIAEYKGKNTAVSFQPQRVVVVVLVLLTATYLVVSYVDHSDLKSENNQAYKSIPKLRVLPQSSDVTVSSPIVKIPPQVDAGGRGSAQAVTLGPASNSGKLQAPPITTTKPRVHKFPELTLLPAGFEGGQSNDVQFIASKKSFSMLPRKQTEAAQSPPLVKIVRKGDTLSGLCLEIYGFYNKQILLWIKNNNPQIIHLDEIHVGEMVIFPLMVPSYFSHATAN